MNNRYLVWIKEGWAFFSIIGIIFFTIVYFSNFEHTDKTYKCFSLIAQLFGGVFILYSINDNIKILQNKTIFFIVRMWLKSFPYFNQSKIVELKGVASVSFVGNAIATGTNHFNTIVGGFPPSIRFNQLKVTYLIFDAAAAAGTASAGPSGEQ
jgi:hypothetical protein